MPENIGYQFNRLYGNPIETYRQVNTITQRNSIPPEIRWEGMECYVITENQDYQLVGGVDNSNWVNAGETPLNPITHFKGFFNATTLTPPIDNTNGIEGDEYKVTDADSGVEVDFGAGDVLVKTGDILIFYQSEWIVKVAVGSGGGGDVSSVFGRTGDVVAQNSDYSSYYSPIITGGASTIVSGDLTASRALVSSSGGKVAVSDVTSTELGRVSGVTSPIQTQLDSKLPSSSYTASDVLSKLLTVDGSGSGLDADTLDGIHASSFLRSDASDNYTSGNLTFDDNTQLRLGSTSPAGSVGHLRLLATGTQMLFDMGASITMRDNGGSSAVRFVFERNTGNFTANGKGTFAGTAIAAPATLSTELVTKGQLDAAVRPYKVYTAIVTQLGTGDPTATVLENTLGAVPVWSRYATGIYRLTLVGAFPSNKTYATANIGGNSDDVWASTRHIYATRVGSDVLAVKNFTSGNLDDGIHFFIEVRVYP